MQLRSRMFNWMTFVALPLGLSVAYLVALNDFSVEIVAVVLQKVFGWYWLVVGSGAVVAWLLSLLIAAASPSTPSLRSDVRRGDVALALLLTMLGGTLVLI